MSLAKIEKVMDEYLIKKAPFQIPGEGRKSLVEWLPWISLVFGILSLYAAVIWWRVGHEVNQLVNYANQLSEAYGFGAAVPELTLSYYAALVAVLLQGVLLLFAFPGLKAKSKSRGWNLLFYALAANFIYGLFAAFTAQGSLSTLIGSIIAVVIGLYLLAQIKSYYSN